ncbi:three-Cys-motif partner protein TcmP [Leptolyngbya iicbica LK]|uniref:Three-Cys-motif partner protein TcmP n=2 Tax=Cyanophyceae TaxID=3028117 RepID=A0A4Q7EK10_9CYAN|nr:three-Cys-motif partner protein TcmP [Leptolyngbya sp. LK]RZM82139.1 three-Cys-motif partner protein TcmP [Leptolyngbya sp. LK]
MGRSKLHWSADGNQMPIISPHTLAKHQILSEYIEHLILTLYGKVYPRGVETFTLIDGFCGGGIYEEEAAQKKLKGSPILMIEAVRKAFRQAKKRQSLNVRYVFVDAGKEHVQCLKNHSMSYWGLENLIDGEKHLTQGEESTLTEQCEFIIGDFEKCSDYCITIASLRKGHSFFLLDPAGWDDVSVATMRKINDTPGSEILYTHMIGQLKRFVIGKYGKNKEKFERTLEGEGYYKKSNLESLDRVGEQMYLRNETARLFREKGFSHLNPHKKHLITFALIPRGKTQVLYYLIHMSRHITALEVIKERFCESNSLDYQYQYEVYGYGFRTFDITKSKGQLLLEPSLYEEEYSTLTINVDREHKDWRLFIKKFDEQIADLIYQNQDGITFMEICQKIGQFNPASRNMYEQYINFLRDNGDVEVLNSKGEILTQKTVRLRRRDVIRVSGRSYFQGSLLYSSRFFN